jgi:GNAT superfamily N-acetyltransferase
MRINEIISESQELSEIDRISTDTFTGGKESLSDKQVGKKVNKLPGGSGLYYSINEYRSTGPEVKIWDPNGKDYIAQKSREQEPKPVQKRREANRDYRYRLRRWEEYQLNLNAPGQLIGKLLLSKVNSFPLEGALKVDIITVDEDYRGRGIATALYGIVLTIMRRPLLAGSSQTPGGRKNWVGLAKIPGVQIKGYVVMDVDDINPSAERSKFSDTTPAMANKNIDIIMGQLGGQYIGKSRIGYEYFSFDIKPSRTKDELAAAVKTRLSNVYNGSSDVGLYAVWTGQVR